MSNIINVSLILDLYYPFLSLIINFIFCCNLLYLIYLLIILLLFMIFLFKF